MYKAHSKVWREIEGMDQLFKSGQFFVGCNYWASHAGTAMWSNWNQEIIKKDFELLKDQGMEVLRVFPLWPYFQPVNLLRGHEGRPVEYRIGEEPLPDTKDGRAGLSVQAMERFKFLADTASQYDLGLIVGLVTGWMSGRLFVPPVLDGRDIFTDPVAQYWQIRFVSRFVKCFKDHPAIWAWDLGNECNCMGSAPDKETAWVWTASIVNAIRAVDKEKPIVSGMHSLEPESTWRIQDQGELTDVLTTHPYPLWTPYCDYEPLDTMRPILHATAESLYYSGIGGKPCFAEELGTMGPMMGSEVTAAAFLKGTLYTLWAHDCLGMLWWCAFDQKHLTHAPYDWMQVEQELGLFTEKGKSKEMVKEIIQFKQTISRLPVKKLPPRKVDAVCIMSHGQEHWPVVLGTFTLSKQAGLDISFCYHDGPLPDAHLYLMPCISGHTVINKRRMEALMDRVYKGATLYISWDGGFLAGFEEITGLRVVKRERREAGGEVILKHDQQQVMLPYRSPGYRLLAEPSRACVIGTEKDGNPLFTVAQYGRGKVYFLSVPVEIEVVRAPGVISSPESPPYWTIYKKLVCSYKKDRILLKEFPHIAITEHPIDEGHCIAVIINYMPQSYKTVLHVAAGWILEEVWHGRANVKDDEICVDLEPNGVNIILMAKRTN